MGLSLLFTYKSDKEYVDENGIDYRRSYVIPNVYDMYDDELLKHILKASGYIHYANATFYLPNRILIKLKDRMKHPDDIAFVDKLIALDKDNCVYYSAS